MAKQTISPDQILAEKAQGMADSEIGRRHGISFHQLQRIITEATGANVSILERKKNIRCWQPPSFSLQETTVWSFKSRGNWATHDGRYRGNWSPYIPRNVMLLYSRPGDVVLDQFAGAGTTAVEAKLLGRSCIARDINPAAISLTKENIAFSPPADILEGMPRTEPQVSVGDARHLNGIEDDSVDLICTHPPYAGIIDYSAAVEGDLSRLSTSDFISEMGKVACECLRVLKAGHQCAVLIGDGRREKHVVPIGFETIRVFLDAGFRLRELIIKRQHNCKTTGFWYRRSIEHNFLLLAHEYLAILDKPLPGEITPRYDTDASKYRQATLDFQPNGDLETTTVWLLPPTEFERDLIRNIGERFGTEPGESVELLPSNGESVPVTDDDISLVLVRFPNAKLQPAQYSQVLTQAAAYWSTKLVPGGFFVVEAQDVRSDSRTEPYGLHAYKAMCDIAGLRLKEIIVATPSHNPEPTELRETPGLEIAHRYVLAYRAAQAELSPPRASASRGLNSG